MYLLIKDGFVAKHKYVSVAKHIDFIQQYTYE